MNVKFGSIAVCLLWANLTHAQDLALPTPQPKPKGRLQLSDLYIQTGVMQQGELPLSLADYRLLAPNSVLLKQDLSSYSSYNYFQNITSNSHFSMLAGINFRDKPNWQLRVGFSQSNESMSSLSFYKRVAKPYDTLTSTQTGQQILVDSVYNTSHNFRHERQVMRLEASLIYRTNPEKRWGFYAGIGASVNLSLNSRTTTAEYKSAYTEQRQNGYRSDYFSYSTRGDDRTEAFVNKNSIGYSFFAPIGVDFRIGKKHPVWSRVHLTYELRPMLQVNGVAGLRKFTNFATQQNLGLRLRLGK